MLLDDVGLGKTITTLTALQLGATLAEDATKWTAVNLSLAKSSSANLGLTPPYKPTLIVCPASAFGV